MIRIFFFSLCLHAVVSAADMNVTIGQDAQVFTLSNGYLTAQVNKRTGDMTSLKKNGLELMGFVSGHHAGYWEQNPSRAKGLSATVSIDPATNKGERGEVSVKGVGGMPFDLEIRYTLGRGEHGIYTYAIFSHKAEYGQGQIGESRYGVKLNGKVFDWLSIDANRNALMPTGEDWDKGSLLNMKEARRMTTGVYQGRVEHKYDYSAVQFEIPAFGWSSTKEHVGLYFINPSMEFLSAGPFHPELTGHLDDGAGGDPTLLDYWRGTHYGGSILPLDAGETWNKVVGPILVYVNDGPDPNAMFQDAMTQAGKEAATWPYGWVTGVDYPHKRERATVSGRLALNDVHSKSMLNLKVGLPYPDGDRMTWQNDAKHYEFWVRGRENGRFTIPNVRPGTYELHAVADGVLGEFAKAEIAVIPGKSIDLGTLEWTPMRYGKQVWEIGIPNRSGIEFFKGDEYFHWGWYTEYAKLFPNDVTYTVGKSEYKKDWFFEQVPHAEHDDGTGRGQGRATTWTVKFNMQEAPQGIATLRLALCGVSARSIEVSVNGQPAGMVTGLVYNATINRDGVAGSWVEKDVKFEASLMKAGSNVLKLTIPAGGVTSGIIYDYLRLELAE